jgi:hypothetical protein
MDMNYYKRCNKDYRFILVCCDYYSRRIFLRALLDKSPENATKGVKSIEDEFLKKGYKIKNTICDSGKEFQKINIF